jgi:hypothetical protein
MTSQIIDINVWKCDRCGAPFMFDDEMHRALTNMSKNHNEYPEHRELHPESQCAIGRVIPFALIKGYRLTPFLPERA